MLKGVELLLAKLIRPCAWTLTMARRQRLSARTSIFMVFMMVFIWSCYWSSSCSEQMVNVPVRAYGVSGTWRCQNPPMRLPSAQAPPYRGSAPAIGSARGQTFGSSSQPLRRALEI